MPTKDEWDVERMSYAVSGTVYYNAMILDYEGDAVGYISSELDARRIVTAVNCFDELVGLAEQYRKNRVEMRSMSGGWPELQQEKYQVEIDRIDAVLAKAREGKNERK